MNQSERPGAIPVGEKYRAGGGLTKYLICAIIILDSEGGATLTYWTKDHSNRLGKSRVDDRGCPPTGV